MCHYCGTKFAKSNNYTEQENEQSTGLNCGSPVQSCKFCGEKINKETVNTENPSSRAMPSISPTSSLRSSDSSLSSCSDILADPNLSDRDYVEDIRIDGNQEAFSSLLQRHDETSHLPVKSNGFHESVDVSNSDGNHEEGLDNNVESVNSSGDGEVDDEFWFPPEPEDQEDDIIGSIANYEDDDDDCGEGWAKPSSFSSFGEEGSGSYKFKEEKLKAMNDVKMGKFRALVSQLVKSVGVDFSGDKDESWVDIVTSLSWEAAAFVKPDADDGKAMDPDGYVKVKCIATGSRTESQLIKGLVFKKRAAHKHMPTKYKNPRLLLIHGSLDLSSSGLSSFDVMQQEDDNLKPIVEMIDMYHPNVILVEKSVSRLIQEAILAKGITLVFDMKLHRLERVARVIGSPIMASEVVIGQKLRQCDSFHIDKFVEEHAVSAEGGKKSTKTLMFLEGAPSRLGCTILLMGANCEELKRVKCVVRCAVVMAYHLMLETSFLLDQTAMFCTTFPGEIVDLALSNGQFVLTNDATSNGLHKIESQKLSLSSEDSSSLSFEACNPGTFPGLSITTSIQKVMNDSFPHGFDGRKQDGVAENDIQISSENDIQTENESKSRYEEDNLLNNEEAHSDGVEEQVQGKDEINSVLDSESILVLMSSRNASRGTICEHSHFSQIKFYRSFDVPLGKFLQDNLLKQNLECKVCKEPPEAHFFYYAHHNKQLTIQVRHLPPRKSLPGETEGKLWMWSRCGRCKLHDGSSKSTKRVLISTAARGLSFGKFLELSFSNHSSFNSLSSCGHSFHKDFLYFFGLGPMVAMFKYSPVVTHSVSLPAQKIEFNASIKGEFLKKDSENVYSKGIAMFTEIEKSLKDLENRYAGLTLNIQGSSKEFSDIVEMLLQEKSQFEAEIENASKNGSEDDAVCKLLRLNKVRLELLLKSCIWDRRLHCLLSSDLKVINSDSLDFHAQENSPKEDPADIEIEKHDDSQENTFASEIKLDASLGSNDLPDKEIQINDQDGESALDSLNENGSIFREDHAEGDSQDENLGSSIKLQTDKMVSVDSSIGEEKHCLENDKDWIWAPSADIQREYMEDLQRGYLPKFESCSSYAAESMAQKVILDEGSRLHIPLGLNDYIISDYEDEYSSIIACALTLLKDAPLGNEDLTEDFQREKGIDSLPRLYSLASPRSSSFNSLDLDGLQSPPSHSLEDVHSSSFDGLDLLESLVSYGAKHPEVSMGLGKHPGTRKYSVLCVYASEFRQLRDRCCPSEVDYIASLSRCRNWDAKGGKSKSFFAKTLDDRFIIKEIKRTEFDSFMKFATNYFDYMNECYELGNQTCLAKILGIYQVVIRGTKNGKEAKHDLLVMENLSFGRKIARQYDLKGALHARLNTAGNSAGDVLLDQNFVNDMNLSPLYVGRKSKRNLQRAVYNDTHFLNTINVMDYSLLVGVDTQRRELVCGIIDYLRQYTWDKQLENWVKSSLVPKNQLPTVISPVEYKKRFRKFINTHFLSVPDHWCSQRSSNPCKLCGPVEGNGSLHPKPVKRTNYDDEASSLKSLQDGE